MPKTIKSKALRQALSTTMLPQIPNGEVKEKYLKLRVLIPCDTNANVLRLTNANDQADDGFFFWRTVTVKSIALNRRGTVTDDYGFVEVWGRI